VPAVNDLATAAFDATRSYADVVHFVHVYVVDPHPSLPDLSPYTGRGEENNVSCPQPRTYEERVARAVVMQDSLRGNQLMLVDALENAVWCTYGPAPNSVFLIDRRGTVRLSQLTANVDELHAAIDDMLGR
jgi:hypothetical protein